MKTKILICILILVIALTGCASKIDNNSSANVDLFEKFENELSKNNIEFEKITKAAEMIGAVEGYGYKADDAVIEVYRFDKNSDSYKSATKNNKVIISGLNIEFDVIFNNEYCIINATEKTLDIFNQLSN